MNQPIKPMYSGAELEIIKEWYAEHLTAKSANWKASTPVYIENSFQDLRNWAKDVVTGQLRQIEYKDELGAMRSLDGTKLPFEDELKFNALVAVAAEFGVILNWNAKLNGREGVVEFAAYSETVNPYIPERPFKSTFVAELDELGEVEVPTDEKVEQSAKTTFQQGFFNLPTLVR